MLQFVSILVTLLIFWVALKIALKVTGCLVKMVIFAIAFWLIMMVLNFSFSIFSFFGSSLLSLNTEKFAVGFCPN